MLEHLISFYFKGAHAIEIIKGNNVGCQLWRAFIFLHQLNNENQGAI